jgi:hypothetical protein
MKCQWCIIYAMHALVVRVLSMYNISFILKFLNQSLLLGLAKNNSKLVIILHLTAMNKK